MPSDPVSQSHLTDFVQVGMRVVLRSRLPEAVVEPGGPSLTDALGDVVSIDPESITVATRRGDITVPRERIVLAKQVPPAPPRRRPRATHTSPAQPSPTHTSPTDASPTHTSPTPAPPSPVTASSPSDGEYSPSVGEVAVTHDADSGTPAISIGDLQALMTAGMPPLCSKRVGYWTLRSANGYTGRANSALLIGDPGLPAEDGIEQVRTWYADQGLPALIQLPHTLGLDPAESDLGSLLAQRNWQFFMRTFVLTRASTPHPLPEGTTVQSYDEPPADWWLTASPRALEHRETLTAMLAMIPDGAYLTAYQNGIALGHARLAFSEGWSGVFDVHTVPDARRRGVARALMSRAELTAYDRRIPLQYLQVAADNDAAVRLYESLGWQVHHEYHYAALRR